MIQALNRVNFSVLCIFDSDLFFERSIRRPRATLKTGRLADSGDFSGGGGTRTEEERLSPPLYPHRLLELREAVQKLAELGRSVIYSIAFAVVLCGFLREPVYLAANCGQFLRHLRRESARDKRLR